MIVKRRRVRRITWSTIKEVIRREIKMSKSENPYNKIAVVFGTNELTTSSTRDVPYGFFVGSIEGYKGLFIKTPSSDEFGVVSFLGPHTKNMGVMASVRDPQFTMIWWTNPVFVTGYRSVEVEVRVK